MAGTSEQLLIRFRGICGHIDLANGRGNGDGRKKIRTVLIRHPHGSPIEHHVPYIEFYADDLATVTRGVKVLQYSKPGVDGRFARVDLEDGTEIRLKNIPPGKVQEEISYQNDVPHMSEVIKKVQIARGLMTAEAKDVDRGRAAAVFDLPEGRIVGGEPEAMMTSFPKEVGFKERRLARWSDLYIQYEGPLVVQLVPLGSSTVVRELTFKKTLRMLTIGNEPERLILGVIGNHHTNGHSHDANQKPAQPTGHYILYYDLLEEPPATKPLPIPSQIEGAGCPNNVYP